MKFSMIVNTICCSVWKICIVCINTSSFLCSFSVSLILFRYSIELMFEIRFWDLTIMRLFNHAFDFALFVKFFSSCIFTIFIVFRDTICVYEFDVAAFFNAIRSLYYLRIKQIIELEFEIFEIWLSTILMHDWIKFNIWFNLESRYNWIFFILVSMNFSMRDFMIVCVICW